MINMLNISYKNITIIALTAVFLLLVGAVFFYIKSPSVPLTDNNESGKESTVSVRPEVSIENSQKLISEKKYASAYVQLEKVLENEEFMEGLATNESYDLRKNTILKYRGSGEPDDSLVFIDNLIQNVKDKNLDINKRAESLTSIANCFHWLCRNDKVVMHIFSDELFKEYYNKGDLALANRDLLLLSYNSYSKTPKTASSLAYWYADELALNKFIRSSLSGREINEYVGFVRQYIKEGDDITKKMILEDKSYYSSHSNVGYLYRKFFSLGVLYSIGKATEREYQRSLLEVLEVFPKSKSAVVDDYAPFVFLLKAQFAINVKNSTPQQISLDLAKALGAIKNNKNPQSESITAFIRDKANDTTGRYSWHVIKDMQKIDSEWNEYVRQTESTGK